MSRVLLVTQPTDGGVFRHVTDLATGLARRGHDVVLAAPLTTLPSHLPVDLVPLPMQRAPAPGPDARALGALAAALRRLQPDIVHAHSSKAGALARLARLAAPRVPVIYTAHGYAFAGHFSPTRQRAYRAVERALAPLATRVLCVCEAERRLAASIGPARRTRVVHNGIRLPSPSASSTPPGRSDDHDRPLIVSMTFLRPGKGLETLIDAMPAILAEHPRAQLRILGKGPDGPALRARAEGLGVASTVEFAAPEDRLEELRAATVFVHPSWAESFPYSILEAMACGLPIVASEVGGIGEAIEDGSSGLLVTPQDSAGLARAISSLLADPARRAALAAAARARVESAFTVDHMVERILDVYGELLGRRRWIGRGWRSSRLSGVGGTRLGPATGAADDLGQRGSGTAPGDSG